MSVTQPHGAGARAEAAAGGVAEAPFGALAPTAMQRFLIWLCNASFLGRGGQRWFMSRQIGRIRPGPVDVERFGLKLRLHHAGNEYSEKKFLLKYADYDRAELAHLFRFAHGDFHFADVGAHAGLYSFAVKSKCPTARIVAFEPHPSYFERLMFNVRTNALPDVFAVRAAAGGGRGVSKLYLELSTLVGAGPSIDIETVPLYETLRELGFARLDGMKIDVEGYEDRVLFPYFEAAPPEFRPRVMVMEHDRRDLWKRDCLALCESLGYRTVGRTQLNTLFERTH